MVERVGREDGRLASHTYSFFFVLVLLVLLHFLVGHTYCYFVRSAKNPA